MPRTVLEMFDVPETISSSFVDMLSDDWFRLMGYGSFLKGIGYAAWCEVEKIHPEVTLKR